MKRTRSERDGADADGVAAEATEAQRTDPTSPAVAGDAPPCDAGAAAAAPAPVESPVKKRQRVTTGGNSLDQQSAMEQEHEEEWNLLGQLPYVALRRLLDFLSFSPSSSTPTAGTSPLFFLLSLVILF
jgi:hypothetical protein